MLFDLWGRFGWWCVAAAALMALESYAYWRTVRGWPPEARIFTYGLGVVSCFGLAAAWVVNAGPGTMADGVLLTFVLFVAGGLGTAPVFLHMTMQDQAPRWKLRRAKKGRGDGLSQ